MGDEFETEDMKKVFSTIMMKLQESDETSLYKTQSCMIDKHHEKSTEIETPENNQYSPIPIISPVKSIKKIKVKDFANTTLARMNQRAQKGLENIKKKRELQKEKEVEGLQIKPDINANSKKLGRRNKPIHQRAEAEINDSKKRILEIKNKLEAEKEAKIAHELTFKPNIITHNSTKRTNEDFFQYNLE